MPELPEVETMRRGLDAIVGGQITAVEKPRCAKRPISVTPNWPTLRRRLIGNKIARTDRRGKRLILVVDDESRLVIEPRMSGLVTLSHPPNQTSLRLRLVVATARATHDVMFWDQRGLGTVRLYRADEFERELGPHRIGPDALECTVKQLRAQLGSSRRAIKVALLDQKAVAGIGNLYASEMLFTARISPALPCDQLAANDWRRLHSAMRRILSMAIKYEGSTLSDGTYRNALNENGEYQNHHQVYDREGEACRRCRTKIVRLVQAQRSTFYCPACQAD